jgi:hypothetical protein
MPVQLQREKTFSVSFIEQIITPLLLSLFDERTFGEKREVKNRFNKAQLICRWYLIEI